MQRAVEALQESQEDYRLLVKNAPLGIISINTQGQVIDVNSTLLTILGWPSADAAREINTMTFLPLIEAGISGDFRRCLESGEPSVSERLYITKWGKQVYLRCHLMPVRDVDGCVARVQAIVEDITEYSRLEEQMRQRDRMAALGRLAGGIAHDCNNILTSIILSTHVLLGEHHLPRDLVPDIEGILDDAQRGARIVKQILDFSRCSYFETHPVDLMVFIQEVADALRQTLPVNVCILLELGQGEYVVHANLARMRRVLVNLAANARDAMPRGGELCISLSRVELRPGEEPPVAEMSVGEWVCLAVSDTGVGISLDVMPYLFEPFFTTKQVGQGTGLGLAQVHGIVAQHGGHVEVATELGRGTTFRIYLPAHRVQETEDAL